MIEVDLSNVSDEGLRKRLLLEGRNNLHAQAVYFEIDKRLKTVERLVRSGYQQMTDMELRCKITEMQILQKLMELPDEALKYLEKS